MQKLTNFEIGVRHENVFRIKSDKFAGCAKHDYVYGQERYDLRLRNLPVDVFNGQGVVFKKTLTGVSKLDIERI